MIFFKESDLKAKQVPKSITLRAVSGNKTMMTFFEFAPNAVIPSHRHSHEQITYIIEGDMGLHARTSSPQFGFRSMDLALNMISASLALK